MRNKYVVRDWLVGQVWEFENYSEAVDKFYEIKRETDGYECDIQLMEILAEHITDNVKSI